MTFYLTFLFSRCSEFCFLFLYLLYVYTLLCISSTIYTVYLFIFKTSLKIGMQFFKNPVFQHLLSFQKGKKEVGRRLRHKLPLTTKCQSCNILEILVSHNDFCPKEKEMARWPGYSGGLILSFHSESERHCIAKVFLDGDEFSGCYV